MTLWSEQVFVSEGYKNNFHNQSSTTGQVNFFIGISFFFSISQFQDTEYT